MPQREKWKKWSPWDWKEIEDIIQSDKHPTNRALSVALSGPKPIPNTVREYLSSVLVKPPIGGRSFRNWEKAQANLVTSASSDIYEAAIDLNILWATREVRRHQHLGKSIADSVNLVSERTLRLTDDWRQLDPLVLRQFIPEMERKYNNGKTLPHNLTRDQLLRLVAKRRGVQIATLRNFDRVHSRRKSK